MPTFHEMGLSEPVIRATAEMGFEEATPIQEQAIPVVMAGKDIIGQAQTGTGKTAAFGIPMIEQIQMNRENIQGLVVTPTRELAVQVAEEINTLGRFKRIRALPIYGGQDMGRQIRSLKNKPQVIVATPGRLMDHMRRKTIRLQQVSMLVLDEADEMLNMGFIDDIETILKEVPADRQTLLFSATMPRPIQELAKRYLKDPEFISIRPKEVTVPNTQQHYIQVQDRQKFDVLCRLLDLQPPELALIFSRTKRRVDELYEALGKRGYSVEALHGDLTQSKRDSVMRNFREGNTEILVATDVAARGLDISGISHVYNFDIPQDPESYVHRIGRTGRLGKPGLAITFVTPREMGHLRHIEQMTKRKIVSKPVPSANEAMEGLQRMAVEKIIQTLDEKDIQQYRQLAQEMLETNDAQTLLSAALKLLTKESDNTQVQLTEEAPPRSKQPRYEQRQRPASRRNWQGSQSGKSYGKSQHSSKDYRKY